MAIMVISTAENLFSGISGPVGSDSPARMLPKEANESHETLRSVRGRARTKDTTRPTTPKTMEQVPCSVRVFIITVKVSIWLPMMKIKKSN